MCKLCYDLWQIYSTLLSDKKTHACPKCNSTEFTTISHITTPTPWKSFIPFSFLHQSTQALRWKQIVNTPRFDPLTQYHIYLRVVTIFPCPPHSYPTRPSRICKHCDLLRSAKRQHTSTLQNTTVCDGCTHPHNTTSPHLVWSSCVVYKLLH